MALRLFRIYRQVHATLDGLGAKKVGGRWNSPGRAVVYMAESVSLAVLENLVHMSRQDFPVGYVCVVAQLPDDLQVFDGEWNQSQLPETTDIEFGDAWLETAITAVFRVRSAVVPSEYNYLINPLHADFPRIVIEKARLFNFDARLFG